MRIEDELQQKSFKSEKQKATLNLLFTSGWLVNQHKEFFKPFGITTQQYNVLRILRGQHPKSISTCVIKERMLDRNSDVSRIVDRLTLKGWVKKTTCPNDRRLVDVVISEDGLNLLKRMDKAVDQLDDNLGGLSEKDAVQLNELLDKIRSENKEKK
ncbi:Transcriptional regulator, MarR family [Fulvivirga imtechensis AK7]|uniref:Transcriptional regulator, MarR family n=1 Tax=Fulvivirga imtechensis AK7 TaxID=1237149 RepID=L8JNH2_9BACT|nr:MarR family transcriptional regulator [Fulvivirga imtechensis]ELR68922.1 Transcriptional regulator, MarR family [Fulvivirga imtechensis AK7]